MDPFLNKGDGNMSLRYTHTLIPVLKDVMPSPIQIQTFLTEMITNQIIGGEPTVDLVTPSNRTRQVKSRITGEIRTLKLPDRFTLPSPVQIADEISRLKEYNISVSGTGKPINPPIPLNLDEPYHVAVTFVMPSALCSTSNLHDESGSDLKLPFYGTPCNNILNHGFFSHPQTLKILQVLDAGCARFWIEIYIGNLFPQLDRDDLNILNPIIVNKAENIFGLHFVQGCFWG
jgi:hypothetical protein